MDESTAGLGSDAKADEQQRLEAINLAYSKLCGTVSKDVSTSGDAIRLLNLVDGEAEKTKLVKSERRRNLLKAQGSTGHNSPAKRTSPPDAEGVLSRSSSIYSMPVDEDCDARRRLNSLLLVAQTDCKYPIHPDFGTPSVRPEEEEWMVDAPTMSMETPTECLAGPSSSGKQKTKSSSGKGKAPKRSSDQIIREMLESPSRDSLKKESEDLSRSTQNKIFQNEHETKPIFSPSDTKNFAEPRTTIQPEGAIGTHAGPTHRGSKEKQRPTSLVLQEIPPEQHEVLSPLSSPRNKPVPGDTVRTLNARNRPQRLGPANYNRGYNFAGPLPSSAGPAERHEYRDPPHHFDSWQRQHQNQGERPFAHGETSQQYHGPEFHRGVHCQRPGPGPSDQYRGQAERQFRSRNQHPPGMNPPEGRRQPPRPFAGPSTGLFPQMNPPPARPPPRGPPTQQQPQGRPPPRLQLPAFPGGPRPRPSPIPRQYPKPQRILDYNGSSKDSIIMRHAIGPFVLNQDHPYPTMATKNPLKLRPIAPSECTSLLIDSDWFFLGPEVKEDEENDTIPAGIDSESAPGQDVMSRVVSRNASDNQEAVENKTFSINRSTRDGRIQDSDSTRGLYRFRLQPQKPNQHQRSHTVGASPGFAHPPTALPQRQIRQNLESLSTAALPTPQAPFMGLRRVSSQPELHAIGPESSLKTPSPPVLRKTSSNQNLQATGHRPRFFPPGQSGLRNEYGAQQSSNSSLAPADSDRSSSVQPSIHSNASELLQVPSLSHHSNSQKSSLGTSISSSSARISSSSARVEDRSGVRIGVEFEHEVTCGGQGDEGVNVISSRCTAGDGKGHDGQGDDGKKRNKLLQKLKRFGRGKKKAVV